MYLAVPDCRLTRFKYFSHGSFSPKSPRLLFSRFNLRRSVFVYSVRATYSGRIHDFSPFVIATFFFFCWCWPIPLRARSLLLTIFRRKDKRKREAMKEECHLLFLLRCSEGERERTFSRATMNLRRYKRRHDVGPFEFFSLFFFGNRGKFSRFHCSCDCFCPNFEGFFFSFPMGGTTTGPPCWRA